MLIFSLKKTVVQFDKRLIKFDIAEGVSRCNDPEVLILRLAGLKIYLYRFNLLTCYVDEFIM